MKTRIVSGIPNTAVCLIFLLSAGGCLNDHVVFTTSTKFALDISQQADQPPKMLLGYKREEGVFLPSPHKPGTENSEPGKKDSSSPAAIAASSTTPGGDNSKDKAQSTAKQTTRTDTYSVVSFFCVMANPSLWDFIRGISPFGKNVPDGLQIHSFFATGVAAQYAAKNEKIREYFQQAAAPPPERAEKRCF